MRGLVADFDVVTPASLDEALRKLAHDPGTWTPLSGGTDLMVLSESGALAPRPLLNIRGIAELGRIEESPEFIAIGALTTYAGLQRNRTLRREFPLLVEAASEVGGVAIQNRGTLGGNIGNASPAADASPSLLVYEAEIDLASVRGRRWIPYREFHTGYKLTRMAADELIARIRLPRCAHPWRGYGRKVGPRAAQAISKVHLAAIARMEAGRITEARIALGSVAATPVRCVRTEETLRGRGIDAPLIREARATLSSEITPIDDIRSTALYRRRVAENLLEEFLTSLR
jgi:CO/xanthine dehydrogenase FAD-binding subunit